MTREEAKQEKNRLYNVDFDYDGDALIDKIFDEFEAEKTENPWHTGTPTETGWYVICFREDGTDDFCVAVWDGKRFIIRDAWDVNIVPTAWQKINESKEDV